MAAFALCAPQVVSFSASVKRAADSQTAVWVKRRRDSARLCVPSVDLY